MSRLPTIDDVKLAAERIAPFVHRTPILTSKILNNLCGGRVSLKCENFQKTGAFKARGACNAVFALPRLETAVATHSSGNHGAAVAYAAKQRGMNATVVVPDGANNLKIEAIRHYGGEIRFCKPGMASREVMLDDAVREKGAVMVHPFDDPMVIAGQGTVALELLADVPDLDLIITPVGGGGLIGGTLLVAKGGHHRVRVVGAEPATADDAQRSLRSGKRVTVDVSDTIADGLRASIGVSNFDLIMRYADDIVCVSDAEIISAMRFIWERLKIIIEPSAAVPVAAIIGRHIDVSNCSVGIVLTGGNVDPDNLPW